MNNTTNTTNTVFEGLEEDYSEAMTLQAELREELYESATTRSQGPFYVGESDELAKERFVYVGCMSTDTPDLCFCTIDYAGNLYDLETVAADRLKALANAFAICDAMNAMRNREFGASDTVVSQLRAAGYTVAPAPLQAINAADLNDLANDLAAEIRNYQNELDAFLDQYEATA